MKRNKEKMKEAVAQAMASFFRERSLPMNANLSRAQQAFKELVTLRRDFHAHPELSWKERRTQQKILEYLDKWGIPAVV